MPQNFELARRLHAFAAAWRSRWGSLGPVGHLNPASGFGDWPPAADLIGELALPAPAAS